MNENKLFIMDCFKKLIKKKTISETDIKESTITDEDIDVLQRKYNVTIPEIYRDFLKTYFFGFDDLTAVVDKGGSYREQGLMIFPNLDDHFKQINERWDFYEKDYKFLSYGYIPIGDWGYGWGPLCIDTNKSGELVKYDDKKTWSLVWFDHEEFFGGDKLEDFVSQAIPAAPDFKELLSWYFLDKYRNKY